MKNRLTITLIGLLFLLGIVPCLRSEDTGPEALISRARAVVVSPHFSREEITKALADSLQASLLILPKTAQSDETRSRIGSVKNMLEKGDLFSDKAYAELGLAYKSVSGGKAWKVPEELSAEGNVNRGIDQAVKVCAKLLDAAAAAYKAGRQEDAVRDLLSMVILVVTPIEKPR